MDLGKIRAVSLPYLDDLERRGWTCHAAIRAEHADRCVAVASAAIVNSTGGWDERWALVRWPAGWPGKPAIEVQESERHARNAFDRLLPASAPRMSRGN